MALPFAMALSRAASTGQWWGDLPAVRDLGLVAVGVGGGISVQVAQAMSLLPLGSRTFRASLGSVLALVLTARLLYGFVRRVLVDAEGMSLPLISGSRTLHGVRTRDLGPEAPGAPQGL